MPRQVKPERSRMSAAVLSAVTAAGVSTTADARVEELIVTATKRAESAQIIPVSLTALPGEELEGLRIRNFDDYLKFLPNVVAMGTGPGQSEIYIRGAATEQSKNTVSSVQGAAPSVALYLDEQPVSFGGRNLDVYAADLERIEVLPGPQGTLFGASSQAGTVRLITRKPEHGAFRGGVKANVSFTRGGDASHAQQVYLNVPFAEDLAVRVVAYHDEQAGWIDNVPNDPANGGLSPNIDVLNRNYVDLDAAGRNFADPNGSFEPADNSALVKDDFNDAAYLGGRISMDYQVGDDWSLLVQHTRQSLETEGVFAYDPNLEGESNVNRFKPDQLDDDFGLTAMNLSGRIGRLDFIYAVGYLDREVEALVDYTGYTSGGGYMVYYQCHTEADGSTDVSGTGHACYDPEIQYQEHTENTRLTQEFRVSMPQDYRARVTAGAFLDRQITRAQGLFDQAATQDDGDGPWPRLGLVADAAEGANGSHTEPLGAGTSFLNDYTRRTEQFALFGRLDFDITPRLTASFGARWYDVSHGLTGATNVSFGCRNGEHGCDSSVVRGGYDETSPTTGNNAAVRFRALGRGDLESLKNAGRESCRPEARDTSACRGAPFSRGLDFRIAEAVHEEIQEGRFNVADLDSDGVINQSDVIFRGSLDWRATDDVLLFAAFGQGFRPPVSNRHAGNAANNPRELEVYAGYRVPAYALTDQMDNYEWGFKADLLDHTLRVNATGYFSDIKDLQLSRFDPSNVAFLVFIENVGNAKILGADGDFTWRPTPGLTLSGAFSFIDSELTRLNPQLQEISVPVGSELPFSPTFSGNLRARYDFDLAFMGGTNAYVSGSLNYTGESKSGLSGSAFFLEDTFKRIYGRESSGLKIEEEGGRFVGGNCGTYDKPVDCPNGRYVQDDYILMSLAAGLEGADWSAELFVDNVTDERAQLHIDTLQYAPRVVTNRPRTFGLRFSWDYR